MPSIQVTGQLVDPTTGVEGGADIRIASLINYGKTTKKSISHKSTDSSGNYDFQLVYGKHLIFVKYEDERVYIPIGYAVVGDSTPDPIDLIQLINLSDENPPSELVTELQQLREDTLNEIVSTSAEVLENAGYKGLWPDIGGGALKGETWQTQVGGTPTGDYYTALQNTTVDPVGDNVNWKAKNDYGSVVANGLVVKHRRGAQSEVDNFTPSTAEIVVNTSEDELVLGNGTTQGGIPIAKKRNTLLNFDVLSDAVSSTSLRQGYSVKVKERIKGGGGGAQWDVVLASNVIPDGFGVVQCTGVPTLALVLNVECSISPAHMGAGRDESDYGDEIQACFDFAEANGMQVTGHGKYFTAKPLSLLTGFSSFATMIIEPTSDFSGADVITIGDPITGKGAGVLVAGLLTRNGNGISTQGMHLKQQEQHLINSGGIGFEKNLIVGSYSITLDDCQGVNGGTGLSVYGQSFSDECNSLIVNGGQYYGNSDYSMNIGDDRLPSTISAGEFFGNKIEVRGATCDQRKIKVDRVIGVKLDVYCEKGGSDEVVGVEAGGSFGNSVRGLDVTGFFTDLDYAVKCLGSVSGIKFTGAYMRSIQRSALYLVSDQFDYTYEGNIAVSSFTKGQEVHTGVRSGITGNAWAGKTIDCYDLYNGRQNENGDHIYPSKKVKSEGVTYDYSTSRYRYYKSPKLAVGTVSGNVFTFNNLEDSFHFNGGDAVNFSGAGGALTYVLAVNYEAGTMTLDSYSFSGVGTISQQTLEPRVELSSFQPPTVTAYRDGSVAWNTYTVDQQTTYWVLKQGVWNAKA